jgi:hypothetical protein
MHKRIDKYIDAFVLLSLCSISAHPVRLGVRVCVVQFDLWSYVPLAS